jgi:hypothetical protein
VRQLAADETRICLFSAPLHTVAEFVAGGHTYWNDPDMAPDGIDFALSIVIGDFGIGSDSPIILDYRDSPPRVLRLQWATCGKNNHWVVMCRDFASFVTALGLWEVEWPSEE